VIGSTGAYLQDKDTRPICASSWCTCCVHQKKKFRTHDVSPSYLPTMVAQITRGLKHLFRIPLSSPANTLFCQGNLTVIGGKRIELVWFASDMLEVGFNLKDRVYSLSKTRIGPPPEVLQNDASLRYATLKYLSYYINSTKSFLGRILKSKCNWHPNWCLILDHSSPSPAPRLLVLLFVVDCSSHLEKLVP
jgi:hypothetical protein